MTREEKLIQQMEQGDSSAADELVGMYYPEILRYCLWHAPNRPAAEDAAQETFLKAIRYFSRYTHQGKFKPFLYRIAANTCIDMARKNWGLELSLEDLSEETPCLDPGLEAIHADLALKQLVKKLPEEQQQIVLLRFGQDMTIREISQVVHLPLRTVQSRLRSALKRLKKEYEEGGAE